MTELSRKKEIFMANYLMTGNVKKASELSEITRKTAYNYLNDATFKRIYRERRSEQLKESTTLLQNASVEAVNVLREIMLDKTVSPYARQQSAQRILNMAYKAVEMVEVVEQLEILEAKILDTVFLTQIDTGHFEVRYRIGGKNPKDIIEVYPTKEEAEKAISEIKNTKGFRIFWDNLALLEDN